MKSRRFIYPITVTFVVIIIGVFASTASAGHRGGNNGGAPPAAATKCYFSPVDGSYTTSDPRQIAFLDTAVSNGGIFVWSGRSSNQVLLYNGSPSPSAAANPDTWYFPFNPGPYPGANGPIPGTRLPIGKCGSAAGAADVSTPAQILVCGKQAGLKGGPIQLSQWGDDSSAYPKSKYVEAILYVNKDGSTFASCDVLPGYKQTGLRVSSRNEVGVEGSVLDQAVQS